MQLKWIGLRPARKEQIKVVDQALIDENGLIGDRYDIAFGDRNVTLIRQEGLEEVWQKLGKEGSVDPALARRNLVVSGLGPALKKMKGDQIKIGDQVVLQVTGYCNPCSRMDENFGPGGLKAMAGHGGLTAKVVEGGKILVGDRITVLSTEKVK